MVKASLIWYCINRQVIGLIHLFCSVMASHPGPDHENRRSDNDHRSLSTCIDIKGRFTVILPNGKKVKQKCGWVQVNRKRCNFSGVSGNCPKTCGDVTGIFKVVLPSGTEVEKNCGWVLVNTNRCNFSGVPGKCPVTCGVCGATQSPSALPTSSPSSLHVMPSPSALPTTSPTIFYFPFSSKYDLQAAVTTFCTDPSAYHTTSSYSTYG